MENLKETGKGFIFKGLAIEIDENYPTHIPVRTMIGIVFDAAKKAGMDSYSVLRDFGFTEEEIEYYFETSEAEKAEI